MRKITFCISVCLLIIEFTGCNLETKDNQDNFISTTGSPDIIIDSAILIPVENISSDYFPCNDCHSEIEPNTQRRELVEMHDDIIFDHDSENRWCLACHNTFDRDSLRLAGGKLLGFNESYKLCGQCHGPKYRDWKLGIHGKRTGEWNGKKQYLLCVHCHDPHSPKFKSLKPETPPRRPENINIDSIYEKPEKNSTSP
ncbi:hypothetical protein ACFLR8_03390 [Bacteroidota bacterium]